MSNKYNKNNSKLTLNTCTTYYTKLCHFYLCSKVSNFSPHCSMASSFCVNGNFETSAPNDPKTTSDATRSKMVKDTPYWDPKVLNFSLADDRAMTVTDLKTWPGTTAAIRHNIVKEKRFVFSLLTLAKCIFNYYFEMHTFSLWITRWQRLR